LAPPLPDFGVGTEGEIKVGETTGEPTGESMGEKMGESTGMRTGKGVGAGLLLLPLVLFSLPALREGTLGFFFFKLRSWSRTTAF
jgi:hypothetical protein